MGRQSSAERESYWRGVISQQKASGQSIAAFCRKSGISAPSFYAWRRRLANRATPQFVALSLPAADLEFEVRLTNGASLVVPSGFDDATLRRLLQVVAEVERGDA